MTAPSTHQGPAAPQPSAPTPKSISVPVSPEREPTVPTSPPREPGRVAPPPVEFQQYLPQELADKLAAARASGEMVGERKKVTILFTDIVNSTALAERLDPEEWGEIVSGAHQRVSNAIYRYEGTIAQLLGDGVLAFFGAPITHEDDPIRAVNAALDIQKSIKEYGNELREQKRVPDFQVRIGINTGLVVVGNIGSDLHMEYLAVGDAINLAARMEQTAQPSMIQIAQETYKQVWSAFEIEDVGTIEVKGKNEPVHAYCVVGRKEVVERARGIEGLTADMVGRDAEMQTMRGIMTDLKQGVGAILFVLGEAGMGKTRLIGETQKVFNAVIGSAGSWHEANSRSYEANQAYSLLQRLIRRERGINLDDAQATVREKLAALTFELPEAYRARSLELLLALFGLEHSNGGSALEGQTFKQELAETLQAWWRTSFGDRPTILVFDDMHSCDAASAEMLRSLLRLTEEMPLILLCAMRSERQTPAWQIKTLADEEYHPRYTEMTLRPLSDAESNELVDRLLSHAELPEQLRAGILVKSGGNPYFIEEVVRTLIDRGAIVPEDKTVDGQTRRTWRAAREGADFPIPDNLQSLLAARMDRLEESTRVTLQIASVIGRSFYHRVLRVVDEVNQDLDKHLAALIRMEMIRQSARVPEVEYAFRNPLTQEAVYKTILLRRRRDFHRRVGEAIEVLYPERRERLYGLLAFHFAQAGERDKAIEYSIRASHQATAVFAYEDAIESLRAALALTEPDDPAQARLSLLEELGDVYRLVRNFDQALASYAQALDRWQSSELGEGIVAMRLHRKIIQVSTDAKWSVGAQAYEQINQTRLKSKASLEENLRAFQDQAPHPETVNLLVALSTDAWRNEMPPNWEQAQAFAQHGVDMAEQLGDGVIQSQALGALANVLDGRSLLREHLNIAQKRLNINRQMEMSDRREGLDALRGLGVALMTVGEYEQALPYLAEAENLAVDIQAVDQQVNALGIQAQCLYRLDRWEEVLKIEERWRPLERRYTRERVGET